MPASQPSGAGVRLTPRGVAVTASCDRTASLVHRFEEELLVYGRGGGVIFDAAADDPECGLAHAYVAASHMFRIAHDSRRLAREAIVLARKAPAASMRERLMICAIECWSEGQLAQAARLLRELIASEPRDLFAAKLLHYFQLGCGDVSGMLETSTSVLPHHRDDARAHAMHAFALEQSGDTVNAEKSARLALEIAPDPWAHHALAHVFDSGRRYAEGQAWMHAHAESWANCSSFLFTHNWWHAALFHIAAGDHDGALDLFHTRVWSMRKDYAQDQINAISLLARLELASVDVGELWQDVAHYVRPNAHGALDGLLDLHHVYALARAGDDLALSDLLDRIDQAAKAVAGPPQLICREASAAVAAFAHGRWQEAQTSFSRVLDHIHLIGGSTVQRSVFRMMHDVCLGRRHPSRSMAMAS